jgi:hypothetical protein
LPWDIEASFQWLKIRRKLRDIELTLDARGYPIDLRGDIWRKRQNFQLSANEILFNGVVTDVGFANLCLVGLRLEADTSKKTLIINPDPRFGQGKFISHANVRERVRLRLLAWEELSCPHEFETIIDRPRYKVQKCVKCGKISKFWK